LLAFPSLMREREGSNLSPFFPSPPRSSFASRKQRRLVPSFFLIGGHSPSVFPLRGLGYGGGPPPPRAIDEGDYFLFLEAEREGIFLINDRTDLFFLLGFCSFGFGKGAPPSCFPPLHFLSFFFHNDRPGCLFMPDYMRPVLFPRQKVQQRIRILFSRE